MSGRSRHKTLIALLPALLLTSCPLALACHSNADLFALSLEELGNVPITGSTLTEKKLKNVPASVSVFTAADIHTLPVKTVSDLMNYVPGMQAFRSSDISSADTNSIRGRRAKSTNVEILVLLNGMKIDNYAVGGNMFSFPNIPLDNVKRIEFIRGPGSAVYGSNAFTGVINIITQSDCNSARVEAGNPGHVDASLQQHWKSQNIDAQLSIAGEKEQGQNYQVTGPDSGNLVSVRDPQYHGSIQLNLTIADSTHLQWVSAHNHSDGFVTASNVDESFDNNDILYHSVQLTQDLHWHPDIDSHLQLAAQYSRLRTDSRPQTTVPVGTISNPPSTMPLLTKANYASAEYSFNWKNDWTLSTNSSLQFGLEYRNPRLIRGITRGNYNVEQLALVQLPVTYYGNFDHTTRLTLNDSSDAGGIYSQFQHQFNSTWEAIAGARYDHYSQIGGHFSPRLGLIAHATNKDSLKLLYGQAFRAPDAVERFSAFFPAVLGNPDLEPETVATWEVIWLREMDSSHLSLNYFYNVFSHAISLQDVGFGREYMNSSNREHSDGIELEWLSHLADFWQLHLTATHLLEVPATFFRESRTLFSAVLKYEEDAWYATATTQFRSSRETLVQADGSLGKLKNYWLVAGKIGYQWTDKLETYGEILNALNKHYNTPASTYFPQGIPNRGRELRIGFYWDY